MKKRMKKRKDHIRKEKRIKTVEENEIGMKDKWWKETDFFKWMKKEEMKRMKKMKKKNKRKRKYKEYATEKKWRKD